MLDFSLNNPSNKLGYGVRLLFPVAMRFNPRSDSLSFVAIVYGESLP